MCLFYFSKAFISEDIFDNEDIPKKVGICTVTTVHVHVHVPIDHECLLFWWIRIFTSMSDERVIYKVPL